MVVANPVTIKHYNKYYHYTLKLQYGINYYFNHVGFMEQKQIIRHFFFTRMNIPPVFTSFNPIFYCPISTTSDYEISKNFSKGTGIILQMKSITERGDTHFDVAWFSGYPHEKEKLFVVAQRLRIIEVEYYRGNITLRSKSYIPCLESFSSIFNGYYIFKYLYLYNNYFYI